MSDQAILSDHRPNEPRRLFPASIFLVCCLAFLACSASAQAAGSSALGWGGNLYGQIGNGTPVKTGCSCVPTPTPVSGLSDATQISGGSFHTLALHANGTVTAWGHNFRGQLGNGTQTDSATPVPVSGLSNVVAVAAGYEHNLALLANGTVMAWGDNLNGELGLPSSGPQTCGASAGCSQVPVQVPGLSDVVAVGADYYYSVALLANGTVMAWGDDYYGQLGDGVGVQSGCTCIEHPVPVPGVSGAMAIAVGEDHVVALLGNGTVTAWGENADGQVGNGTSIEAGPPDCLCVGSVAVGGLAAPVSRIDAGAYEGLALLGGVPWAWGFNADGELGRGIYTITGCECIPTPGAVLGLSGVQSVAAGDYHTLALLGDGSLRAWGYNAVGQVGDGTEARRNAPVPVGGVSGANDVSAGDSTSFALIGSSRTLTVSLAGAGTGAVGGPDGILCPAASCAGRFPDSQVQILRAEPGPGTGFAGFTGACTGTGTCQVRMDTDMAVTATFGPPGGTGIIRAKIKQGKKPRKGAKRKPRPTAKATFSFTAPGAVTGYQCMLVKPKPKKARKRAKPRFSSCSSSKRYKKLRKGRYVFKVRAENILGVDAQPAVRKFKIRR